MKRILTVVLLAVAAAIAGPAWTQDKTADLTDLQVLRESVKTDKKAFVAATLALTDAEAKKFWPLYDAYQRVLDATNRQRVVAVEGLISRGKPVTNLYARNLANELIAADEAEIKARRTLHTRVMRTLPAIKAARYLQLESKIRAIYAYDIASTIPLIR